MAYEPAYQNNSVYLIGRRDIIDKLDYIEIKLLHTAFSNDLLLNQRFNSSIMYVTIETSLFFICSVS